jgi:hypothetical protein
MARETNSVSVTRVCFSHNLTIYLLVIKYKTPGSHSGDYDDYCVWRYENM